MILIIDNYDSFTYNLYQAVTTFHQQVKVIRNDQITVDDIKQISLKGIILSPGPGRPENAGICVDIIRAILERSLDTIPLLGVCLGHQAITLALGGKIIQANEIMHGKVDQVYHHQQDLYQLLPSPFEAGRYHSLIAERETLPTSLIIEAENQKKTIMGIKHTHLPIYGVQFHPESILTPQGNQLISNFVDLCHSQTMTKGHSQCT